MHLLWEHCYTCYTTGADCSASYPRIKELNDNTGIQMCPKALFMRIARGFSAETSQAKHRAQVLFRGGSCL